MEQETQKHQIHLAIHMDSEI